MGTKFANSRGKNLYEFWGSDITQALNQQLKLLKSESVVNLASNEYFKSVKTQELNAELITPVFKDKKNGEYKIISFYAKKARGMMSAYVIKNGLVEASKLKQFNSAGYAYSETLSEGNNWVFTREQQG
jgi:hypothetical protein